LQRLTMNSKYCSAEKVFDQSMVGYPCVFCNDVSQDHPAYIWHSCHTEKLGDQTFFPLYHNVSKNFHWQNLVNHLLLAHWHVFPLITIVVLNLHQFKKVVTIINRNVNSYSCRRFGNFDSCSCCRFGVFHIFTWFHNFNRFIISIKYGTWLLLCLLFGLDCQWMITNFFALLVDFPQKMIGYLQQHT